MLVILKGCNFEHTKLSIHNSLSQESKLTRVQLQLNLCPSKSTTPVLKRIFFRYLKVNLQP